MRASLYFAFPVGVFDYQCAECTNNCCRRIPGFTGSLRREMGTLLFSYPSLQHMVVERRGEIVSVAGPRGSRIGPATRKRPRKREPSIPGRVPAAVG
jgi:hypothetical protein